MIELIERFWEPVLYFLAFVSLLVIMKRAVALYDRFRRNRQLTRSYRGWSTVPIIVADYRIIVPSMVFRVRRFSFVSCVLCVMVLMVWAAFLNPDRVSGTVALVILFVGLMIPVAPFVLIRDLTLRLEYDDHTIRKSSIYGRSKSRNLRDIVDVKAHSGGFRSGVVLCFEDGVEIAVSADYDGFGHFLVWLSKHNNIALGLLVASKALPDPRGGYRADVVAKF